MARLTGVRVSIRSDGNGGFEAKLRDLDIAVRSDTEAGIVDEIRHALVANYELDCEFGRKPFAAVRLSDTKLVTVELPDEVFNAMTEVMRD